MMKRSLICGLAMTSCFFLVNAHLAEAQPLLQWTFDESDSGDQIAIDGGQAPSEDGEFFGGATRTSNTPGGASTGAADLFLGATGNDAYIESTDVTSIDGLESITITAWINLQGDPTGNDRIAALQAVANPPNADFNGSDLIDGDDLQIWRDNYGMLADGSTGDANANGEAEGSDFTFWQRQFGGPPGPLGNFAGFSLNINAPTDGTYSANDFRLGMFIGGLDGDGDPVFDFGQSIDIEGQGAQWLFVATTYDGTSGDLTFFTGTEGGAATQLGSVFAALSPFQIETTNGRFYVGKTEAAPTADTSLEGFIDDVRIYDSALDLTALDAIRLENLPALLSGATIPEPTSFSIAMLALVAAATSRNRTSS